MTTLSQRSFASGELSPSLYARVDFFRYSTGLRTCKNCIIFRFGGAGNRPGSEFINEINNSSQVGRLIPYEFTNNVNYILEFGDVYFRVYKNGEQVRNGANAFTGATQTNPVVITLVGHPYSTGDEVYIEGVKGMTELNNRNYKITSLTANTFSLQDLDGTTDIDGTGFGAYTSGGTADSVVQFVSPYVVADLADLKFAQSEESMIITHESYPPYELKRVSDTSWTLEKFSFAPDQVQPDVIVSITGGVAGSLDTRYMVTAVNEDGVESLPSASGAPKTITGLTAANPPEVTITAHGYETGDLIQLDFDASSTPALDGKQFKVTRTGGNTFELQGIDLSNETISLTGTNTATLLFAKTTSLGVPTSAAPNVVTWGAASGAVEYNLYKYVSGTFGLLAVVDNTEFEDIGESIDTSVSPPVESHRFFGEGNYPKNVTYVQQRLTFSNTNNNPDKIFMSRTGDFANFYVKKPIGDDSVISFRIRGNRFNPISSVVELGNMVIMSETGEWSVVGGDGAVITPTTIDLKQNSYNGSSNLDPVIIEGSAAYVQARGTKVRDLSYNLSQDGYTGGDLTIFSSHLFDGYTISRMAYQQIPHSILWCVRSDGTLLGLTLVRNQQVVAWHRHNIGDAVEDIAIVPEGSEDVLYLLVKRTINGSTRRYIERLSTKQIDAIEDASYMDSYQVYDGRNTSATTMTLSGGSGWTFDETLTLTASTSFFESTDIGNQIFLDDPSDGQVRFTIDAYTSPTVVTGTANKTVPASLRSTAITGWAKAVDKVAGLWHLEGEAVSVLADGFVAASPNNEAYTTVTVTNGAIELDKPYSYIRVGAAYLSDLGTLDINTVSSETLADKYKLVTKVNMQVESTRGVWVGPDAPSDDATDPLDGLTEVKGRNNEAYDAPPNLRTEVLEVNMAGNWNKTGRVFIRQVDPLPMNILSIEPAGKYPLGGTE